MLTQQCFFSLRKLKCAFDLCTLNRVYLRSNRLVRPTIKFTSLLYNRPCPSWNLTSIKFDFNFSLVIMKSLSMVSKDNSVINFSQCRILSVTHQSPIVTHRHSPSLTVTPHTHCHSPSLSVTLSLRHPCARSVHNARAAGTDPAVVLTVLFHSG